MSASESYSDNSSMSFDSDLDVIKDYELEVEEFDSPSEQDEAPSTSQAADMPDNTGSSLNSAGAVAIPYKDEPIADDDWVERYEEEMEIERNRFETLEKRLDGRILNSDW